MKNLPSSNNSFVNQANANDDEINLKDIITILLRHKFLIAKITVAVVALTGIYAYTREPVWEGQFQIVLENQGSRNSLASQIGNNLIQTSLTEIVGGGGISQLETEIKILESPSVLKPTYDFVKKTKASAGENISNWSFIDWRDSNLSIELETGTSVLNIAYRDTDPNIVLPVIEKISREYQRYSGRDRSKSISNGIAFTKLQLKKFREKAAKSTQALDAFSIRYGISNKGGTIASTGIDIDDLVGSGSYGNLGNLVATNFMGIENDPLETRQGDPHGQLASINQELIRRQQRFTNSDPSVQVLIRERDALRRYMEMTAGGTITLPDQQARNKKQAQELVLEFQELRRTAQRDLGTLNTLEGSLLSLQLEQARQTDPWELISTPTFLDKPVEPRKKRMVAFGFIGGIILGCGASLIQDRRSGLVFSEDELKNLLPCPLLKHLPALSQESWTDAADLIAAGPLSGVSENSSVGLIPLGNMPNDMLEAFGDELRRALSKRKLVISTDLRETSRCATQILVTKPGVVTRTQLSQISQKLALQGSPLAGWVLLDPGLDLG